MLNTMSALIAGLVFGLGLIYSGMTNPSKIVNFLNITGRWDASLAFVMAGALIVGVLAFTWAKKHTHSLLGEPMQLPQNREITPRLILGSVTFGIGWGLAGYCPGPALASVLSGGTEVLTFTGAMLVGILIFKRLNQASR
jgi:uncharacterized protein